jgi:exodeoxyribonuclease-1
MVTRKPVLHVSMMYPAVQGCLALVMPICSHPTNNNGIIVYDLRVDPDSWTALTVAEMRERIFIAREDMAQGVERIPLKTLHINKCPVIASPAVLPAESAEEFGVDLEKCRKHWSMLQNNQDLVAKVAEVFTEEMGRGELDPDYMIYSGGFFSESDKSLMAMIRSTSAKDLARLDLPFRDSRLATMLQRYRARNFKDTLNDQDLVEWNKFRQERLSSPDALAAFEEGYAQARERAGGQNEELFIKLDEYVAAVTNFEEKAAS